MDIEIYITNFEKEFIVSPAKVSAKQTENEMDLWATDENYTELEKANYLLKNGYREQKSWALKNLPSLLTHPEGASLLSCALVTFTQSQALQWTEELQLDLGQGLATCFQLQLIPQSFYKEILDSALTFLSFYSKTQHESWLPVYAHALYLMPPEYLVAQLVPEVLLLSESNQKNMLKEVSAVLLELLARALKGQFKGPPLSRCRMLSQDPNEGVRGALCSTWLGVVQSVPGAIEEVAYSETMKLLHDHSVPVKAKAFALFIQMLPSMSSEFLMKEPWKFTRDSLLAQKDPVVLWHIAQQLGPLVASFSSEFREKYRGNCLDFLETMLDSTEDVKGALVDSLPAVCSALGLCKRLFALLGAFAVEQSMYMRQRLALGLHEIAGLCPGSKTMEKIANGLLSDSLTALYLLRQMQFWVGSLGSLHTLTRVVGLLQGDSPWRAKLELLGSLCVNVSSFQMSDITEVLLLFLFEVRSSSYCVLQRASARLLASVFHECYYLSTQEELCEYLKGLARSESCYARFYFLEVIEQLFAVTSKRALEKTFIETVISLGNDVTHSVRLKYATMVTRVRECLQNHWFEEFKVVLKSLVQDSVSTVKDQALLAKSIIKSREFIDRLYSEAEQKVEQEKVRFEEDLLGKEMREQEEKKTKIIDELAAKARAEMQGTKGKKTPAKIKYPVLKKPESTAKTVNKRGKKSK